MGEARVDLLHLLEDLRDAYPGALEETILTEIVANALDSGASRIDFACDPVAATLTVTDNGCGMRRRELARYHDVAASAKTRGEGIGFAGVGIKLALLVCEDVVTETRRGKSHVASRWRLASRHKAPWKWEVPPGLVVERGTAVRMRLANSLSPLLDTGFVEATVRHGYRPLFEPPFRTLLASHYTEPPSFVINDREIRHEGPEAAEQVPIEVRLPRRRKPSAVGYLVRETLPLAEDERGLAISTLGKIIKRGWDWIATTPADPERVGGLVEVPALAECLTLNKADFIRTGSRGATFLAYRKALQEVVARQLAEWGDGRNMAEESRRRAARPVERDLERVLADLADRFPLVSALVERREGGQRRLPLGVGSGANGGGMALTVADGASAASAAAAPEQGETALAVEEQPALGAEGQPEPAPQQSQAPQHAVAPLPGEKARRRPARYGLEIRFENREGERDFGRLIESTVWVNVAHPAYQRAAASHSEGYHLALSVAMALAPLAVEPSQERAFVAAFLECWGSALAKPKGKGRRRR